VFFAFECPIAYLKQFQQVSDFDFILAHLLKDRDYYNFYKKSNKFKILDNGACELGKSIDTDNLIKWAYDLEVDMLVAPDCLLNKNETIKLWKKFKKDYAALPFKIMAVPQGKTVLEYVKCLEYFEKEKRVDIIGLGYKPISTSFYRKYKTHKKDVTTTRLNLVKEYIIKKPTHLLGLGSSGGYEILHNNISATTDSASPVILAIENKSIPRNGRYTRTIPHLDFYYKFNKKVLKLAIQNALKLKGFSSE